MRRALVCAPVALLFLASVLPSYAQKAAAAGERVLAVRCLTRVCAGAAAAGERVLAVAAGAPLAVECELRVEQRAEWRLDGAPPPADMRASELPAAGGAEGGAAGGAAGGAHGLTARLEAARARPQHAGLYTCAAGAPPVRVVLRPHAATQHDTEPATAEKAEAGVGAGAGAGAEATLGGVLYYEVRTQLSLDCRGLADDPATLVWTANGTNVFEIPALKDRVDLKKEPGKLIITGRSHEDDFGNYTCAAGPGLERSWEVRGKPRANLSPNTNVVEGQKLKLTCKLTGKPYPAVRWLYSNTSAEASNDTLEVTEALDARVTLAPSEQGVPGAQLVLEPAQRSDAGWFTCVPLSAAGANSTTVLRVKDMYAALWPFLGICAEVFVLCAVILVYEKRRAKPELDDSDTDNHDPKKS